MNIKPGFDKYMALLALRNPTLQRQCYQVLRSSLVANAILLYRACEVANKCVAEELERTSDSMSDLSESATKSTKRGMYEKYTPKEKAECYYAWYHSHNKASPCLAKLCSSHEIFYHDNFANLECFTIFLCLKNLELHGKLSASGVKPFLDNHLHK